MKPILFVLAATVLFAIQNVIIDVKLKQYSTVCLMLGSYVVVLPLGIIFFLIQRSTAQGVTIPAGGDAWVLLVTALMFFVADYFYVGAYTNGGNAVSITMVLVLMPVFAGIVKFIWTGETPSAYHIAGGIFAAGAIALMALGDQQKKPLAEGTAPASARPSPP